MRLFRLSSLFTFIFLVLFSIFLLNLFQRYNPWGLDSGFKSYAPSEVSTSSASLIRMEIESLEVNLPVIPAVIKNNKFETTKKGISYLATSGFPGKEGNAIFYGHNWTNILGNLSKIRVGDSVKIYTGKNEFVIYKIEYTAKVNPDEVHILSQTQDSRITIYTCTGFLDSKRFVAVGTLQK